jgi:predicted ABC-type ATPase
MRMFAGPNGSGKSVLKSYLPEPLLGVYLNADEIEAAGGHGATWTSQAWESGRRQPRC